LGLIKQTLKYSALVAIVALVTTACDKVPLLAPANSAITLSSNSLVVPVGGTTGLTAFVTESSGTAVQNGTTVRFTATLGSVTPAETQTTNGIAIATFQAGTSSGIAEIHAVSGGATGATGTTTTTTATNIVRISIGSAAANKVTVRANPASVSASGGAAEIVALVTGGAASTDTSPLAGISVAFSTTAGTLSATSATTDANGAARVVLTTNRKATVTGSVGANSGTVDVTLSPTASVTLATSPASPTVGQAILLTVTPAADTAPSVVVEWGDGSNTSLGIVSAAQTVSHVYRNLGSFAITATATEDGSSFSTSTAVTIGPAPSVTITSNPSTGKVATNFVFTVTPATANGVKGVTIDFGDGNSQDLGAITSATSVSHIFSSTGAYTVKAIETDGSGNTTSAIVVITVSS
jgi:adhesin/invasin